MIQKLYDVQSAPGNADGYDDIREPAPAKEGDARLNGPLLKVRCDIRKVVRPFRMELIYI